MLGHPSFEARLGLPGSPAGEQDFTKHSANSKNEPDEYRDQETVEYFVRIQVRRRHVADEDSQRWCDQTYQPYANRVQGSKNVIDKPLRAVDVTGVKGLPKQNCRVGEDPSDRKDWRPNCRPMKPTQHDAVPLRSRQPSHLSLPFQAQRRLIGTRTSTLMFPVAPQVQHRLS
jgi:hypothetical protein